MGSKLLANITQSDDVEMALCLWLTALSTTHSMRVSCDCMVRLFQSSTCMVRLFQSSTIDTGHSRPRYHLAL